ncbi:MAG: SDR family oxidoreductase [Oscillospiraceae bacterium]|nr:SDR family oxidoreductase [Oscillospiraceae bacterium]
MNAVITGANRGIGKALTENFASTGYDIWACARKYNKDFEDHLRQLADKYHVDIQPVYFDLADTEQTKAAVTNIIKEKKDIDVLINNAGIAHGGLLTMTPIEKMKEVYEVNVFAQVQIMQLIARRMMKQKSGCIINMCSVGGIETEPGYLAYGSSKAALIWITRSAAKELGKYNIRVNGIAPGLVETDMGNYKSEEEKNKVLQRMSLGRTGSPEEIASAALYIASDAASYMTGHIMVLDGGRV